MSVYFYIGEWGDFLWEEAYTIIEAEKSHNILSTSWRLRKARGHNSVWPWRHENKEATDVKVQSLKAWEPGALMYKGRRRWLSWLRRRENSSFLHRFVLFELSVDWRMPTHIIVGRSLFSLPIQVDYSLLKHPHRQSEKICFYQLSGHSLARLSWHVKLTITNSSLGETEAVFNIFILYFLKYQLYHHLMISVSLSGGPNPTKSWIKSDTWKSHTCKDSSQGLHNNASVKLLLNCFWNSGMQ